MPTVWGFLLFALRIPINPFLKRAFVFIPKQTVAENNGFPIFYGKNWIFNISIISRINLGIEPK